MSYLFTKKKAVIRIDPLKELGTLLVPPNTNLSELAMTMIQATSKNIVMVLKNVCVLASLEVKKPSI